MFITILILPIIGSFISGFIGRKIGVNGTYFITCICLIISAIFSIIAFYEVGICHNPITINLIS